jgi:hypothetical protein
MTGKCPTALAAFSPDLPGSSAATRAFSPGTADLWVKTGQQRGRAAGNPSTSGEKAGAA